MIKVQTKTTTEMSPKNGGADGGGDGGRSEDKEWELRPGGMLVQKRDPDLDRSSVPAPTIRIRVKHGSSYHEIYINSQASFGELKKMLSAPTGLHPEDQKLMFKNKERSSKSYLDIVGVKDRSKIVLVEDPISQEKRFLEMRRTAKMEKSSKSISEISLQVDKLATQVSSLETVISKGGKVGEIEILNLIELLMTHLIKLDGIYADGDVKLQRRMQVKRVQKCVETLDMLKIKNSMASSNGVSSQQGRYSTGQVPTAQVQHHQPVRRSSTVEPPVVTTNWENFDFGFPGFMPNPSTSTKSTTTTTKSTTTTTTGTTQANKLSWEFFE